MKDVIFNSYDKAIITTIIVIMIIQFFIFDILLLDIIIVLNIIFTLSLLISTIWTENSKNISFYPSFFFFSTVFNLVVNISVTYFIFEKGGNSTEDL